VVATVVAMLVADRRVAADVGGYGVRAAS
jgi:hypothetical protein